MRGTHATRLRTHACMPFVCLHMRACMYLLACNVRVKVGLTVRGMDAQLAVTLELSHARLMC